MYLQKFKKITLLILNIIKSSIISLFILVISLSKTLTKSFLKLIVILRIIIHKLILKIHKLILKTNHPIKIYSFLSLFIIYLIFASTINFQIYKTYNIIKFEWKLSQAKANLQASKTEKEEQITALKTIISSSLTTQIEKVITSEKKLCIDREMLAYKQDIRSHSFIYPSNEELISYETELSNGICSIKNLQDNTYILLLRQIFGENTKLIKLYKNNTETKETSSIISDSEFVKKVEEIKKKLEKKEIEKKIDNKTSTTFININEKGAPKQSPTKIKAIFCSYWHGLGTENGWIDNGATSRYQDKSEYNGITERDLIMQVMSGVCKWIQEKVKDKGIIVYEIGKKRMQLKDKIKIINEISKKKWYDEHTAIGVELHYNTASSKERSWVEVIYSQLETTELGFFGPDLANNMLYQIRKTHNFGNLYRIKSDASSRYKSLGILSETKPTMILVEYGFLTNSKDVEFAKNHIKEEQESIINGIVSYIK